MMVSALATNTFAIIVDLVDSRGAIFTVLAKASDILNFAQTIGTLNSLLLYSLISISFEILKHFIRGFTASKTILFSYFLGSRPSFVHFSGAFHYVVPVAVQSILMVSVSV